MNKKLLLILMLSSFSIFGQQTTVSNLSSEQLKLRNDLENDSSIIKIGCGLFTETDLNTSNSKQGLKLQKQTIKIRKKIFDASKNSDKTVKAKSFCGTVEAGVIVHYLLVDKGKIRYISDYSRDPFSGLNIKTYDCEKVLIGYFVSNEEKMKLEFISFKQDESRNNKIPVLQCQSENKELFF
jgi:hypothetical protein